MKASVIRRKYLEFFKSKGHAIIPAAPIIPLDDPTTLFTSSGMQQLVPYLKGQSHPMGTRLTDSQPSFRAEDIEEVGDNRHTTMFEMLGNWSLGDYFKSEQLPWIWEFFTQVISLDPSRLYITVFAGDAGVDQDNEAISIWQKILNDPTPARPGQDGFDPQVKIYTYSDNWWSRAGGPDKMPVGEIGGPDSEVFFDFGQEHHFHENSPWADQPCHLNCDCGRFLEIGNSVFMQFVKTADGMEPLPNQNVDFGGGFERIVAAAQDTPDIFATDLYAPIISSIEKITGKKYQGDAQFAMRTIADHLRAASFMAAQDIVPSNKMQGYFMRRLLRRAAVKSRALGGDVKEIFLSSIPTIIKEYAGAGFIQADSEAKVKNVVSQELDKFSRALARGERELGKAGEVNEKLAFDLYQSLGFPFEITQELTTVKLDEAKFNQLLKDHQDKSRTASAGMFKGGLADHSEITTKYHTATHLFHQALADVLGEEIAQAGSNITPERLRFDYTYSGKPTEKQLKEIEQIVNQKVNESLPVTHTVEDKKTALESGVKAFFADKYPDKVTVYRVGDYSAELCGGPHVNNTKEIGKLELFKEKNLGSGKRRLYARLVN